MSRDVTNFKTFWKTTTFSSILDPTIYLLAFGLGLGTLVAAVQGIDYVEFVGTGMVATAVLFSSAFSAMYGVFIKHRFQHTYDAILAAPVDVEELVTAEVTWLGVRAGIYGVAPLLVTMLFGLDPSWGMLAVPVHRRDHRRSASPALGVFAAAVGEQDRPLLLHPERAAHAAVPRVRARSSRSTSCRRARRSIVLRSTRSTTASAGARRGLRRSRPPTSATSPSWSVFALVTWRVAIWRMEKRLIE